MSGGTTRKLTGPDRCPNEKSDAIGNMHAPDTRTRLMSRQGVGGVAGGALAPHPAFERGVSLREQAAQAGYAAGGFVGESSRNEGSLGRNGTRGRETGRPHRTHITGRPAPCAPKRPYGRPGSHQRSVNVPAPERQHPRIIDDRAGKSYRNRRSDPDYSEPTKHGNGLRAAGTSGLCHRRA